VSNSSAEAERGDALKARILALLRAVDDEAERQKAQIEAALPKHRASALNLAHYIGLRKRDIRRLQLALAALGLSSLGRSEGHVRDALLRLAGWLGGSGEAPPEPRLDWGRAEAILHANTRALFGAKPSSRHVYIMVTAPEAADATSEWADEILAAGTDLLRINCAHESAEAWERTASVFRSRAALQGRKARIFVDVPGPKLRADIVQREAGILHLPRRKDRAGRTVAPTSILLVAHHQAGAQLPLPAEWVPALQPGDLVALTDAGGRPRELVVRELVPEGARAECDRSLFFASGLELEWRRDGKVVARGAVGPLPERPRDFFFSPGDRFLVNASGASADPALPAIACPEPKVLDSVRVGERVVLDDGRLVALTDAIDAEGLHCRVLHALKAPTRLRSGKGIAFPDSRIALATLGLRDEQAIGFALEHADGIEVSFVNTRRDVALIVERLRAANRPGFGLVLKLETREAMRNLPGILFEALRYDPVGLMIARGDLAVELSFERLAEMQEELLWFGEACHLPVIWATQVLDSLAHSGIPTRAEVTDAAMSMRAECVMLNKGPHIAAAVRMLADIIRKMEAHQYKKRSIYRPLSLAAGVFEDWAAAGKATPQPPSL